VIFLSDKKQAGFVKIGGAAACVLKYKTYRENENDVKQIDRI